MLCGARSTVHRSGRVLPLPPHQFFEGIRSERQLVEFASLNLAHRWYLGYHFDEPLPDRSSLVKIRQRLNPAHSEGVQLQASFHCTDTGASYGLMVRSEVADVLEEAPPDATIDMQTTEPTLRGLLTGRISWQQAVEDDGTTLNRGTAEETAQFWSLFDPPAADLPAVALR